jgi:transposase InsO family protein
MIEIDRSSAAASVELLDSVQKQLDTPVPILEIITGQGSEFVNTRQNDRPDPEHEFEVYLHEHSIVHSFGKVGRPQTNGRIERFYQTYKKHRWRLGTLEVFLSFYNDVRPHMSLDWDNLETPADAFDRLLLSPAGELEDPLDTEVGTNDITTKSFPYRNVWRFR